MIFYFQIVQIKSDNINAYHGMTKDPETNNFMIVMDCRYGLCEECMQPYTENSTWSHQLCNAQRFQQNFKNWTSGNHATQLKAKNSREVLEWIEYDRFENIEYI